MKKLFQIIKENKTKTLLIVISVLVVAFGVSFAYFFTTKLGNSKSLTYANLSINYVDGENINSYYQLPLVDGEVDTFATRRKFNVTNTGNVDGYLEISLDSISIPNELKNQYFRWTLYEEDNQIANGNFDHIENNSIKLKDTIYISKGATKSFGIAIWIQDSSDDQNDMLNKTFNSAIKVSMMDKKIVRDTSGANAPVLADGMIPVTYDEASGNWEVADKNNWYNYDKQIWANAVTTSNSSYRTAAVGTEIPMSSINTMWVWIPRYKYKIPSNIGSSSNVTSPPQIDVVFESGTNTTGSSLSSCSITSTTCYYTHPAFRNGSSVYKSTAYDQGGWDSELDGIWVGKFETSGNSTTPTIKPDVASLRSQNISTQFDTSLKFAGGTRNTTDGTVTFAGNTTYGLTSTTDTHMMKNTEWGAVAILSQSKYGKMGNPNYNGADKEVFINNSSSYYTGRSGGGPGGSIQTYRYIVYPTQSASSRYISYGYYTYDDYLLNYNTNTKGKKKAGKGTGASTTGTIYGIYDMVGCAYEYLMSNWFGTATTGTVGSSGFTTSNYPGGSNGSKYYDTYRGSTSSATMTSDKAIKGDATYETIRWYYDQVYSNYSGYPWLYRGASYSLSTINGIFYSYYTNGAASNYAFRTVLIP